MKDKIKDQLISVREIIVASNKNNKELPPEIVESLNIYRELILKSLSRRKKLIMNKVIPPIDSKNLGSIDNSIVISLIDQMLLLNNTIA